MWVSPSSSAASISLPANAEAWPRHLGARPRARRRAALAGSIFLGGTQDDVRRRHCLHHRCIGARNRLVVRRTLCGHFAGALDGRWSASEWSASSNSFDGAGENIPQDKNELAPGSETSRSVFSWNKVVGFRHPILRIAPVLYTALAARGFRYDTSGTGLHTLGRKSVTASGASKNPLPLLSCKYPRSGFGMRNPVDGLPTISWSRKQSAVFGGIAAARRGNSAGRCSTAYESFPARQLTGPGAIACRFIFSAASLPLHHHKWRGPRTIAMRRNFRTLILRPAGSALCHLQRQRSYSLISWIGFAADACGGAIARAISSACRCSRFRH